MMDVKFSDISDSAEFINYLNSPRRMNNVQYLNKYMSVSTLNRILSSEMLLINNPYNMNDRYEYSAFENRSDWSKICFSSFITQSTENIAMWGMYAQPWNEGIMISIPVAELKDVIKNTKTLYSARYDSDQEIYTSDGSVIPADGIISLHRVAYIDGNTITCTGRNDRNSNFIDPYSIPDLAGYIKDVAWGYEKEVRLRVDLPDDYEGNAVFLKLPEVLLKRIRITCGPRFNLNIRELLPVKFNNDIFIQHSKFYNKIANIPCDYCEKKKK